ncbi:hypothetical protein Ancab_029877 [Ancistrocladus abbreviatus]
MGEASSEKAVGGGFLDGFAPVSFSTTRIFWQSRRKRAKVRDESNLERPVRQEKETSAEETMQDSTPPTVLSEKRKALFEPLEPIDQLLRKLPSNESLLPPPDFDTTTYPKGWLIGKKRKLVNVDVVESMRRIAIQEMNRKDREINGLNEQLEEDARCLEHLQIQLLEERGKRADVERENAMLQDQINMLMNMLQENETMGEEGEDEGAEHATA